VVAACLLLAIAGSVAATSSGAVTLRVESQSGLALEDILSIRYPSQPAWAPDSQRMAFLWEDGGVVELWWAAAGGGAPQRLAAAADGAGISGFDWAADARRIAYVRGGGLFLGSVTGDPTEQLTGGDHGDSEPVFSPDGDTIAFIREGQIWLLELASGEERQLTSWQGTASGPEWNADGSHLVALVSERSWQQEPARELVGRRMAFFAPQDGAPDLACVDVADGTVVWLERGAEYSGQPTWSATGKLAWQQVSADAKRRRILVAEGPEWQPVAVVDETDAAWWSLTYLEAGPRWEPGAERIAFLSDQSGWTHLYVIDVSAGAGAPAVQVTRGEFEVEAPRWHPAGGRLVLAANRGAVTERSLFLVDVPGEARYSAGMQPITRLRGTSTSPRWSPDAARLLFLHADTHRPLDIWIQSPSDDEARQVSHSWDGDVREEELLIPQVVSFPSNDGQLVTAQLTLPRELDPDVAAPAIVWVHGGGIRQNRYGWHPLRPYAIFYGLNQYLAQQGYLVLAVDYRGSIGYGRDFRVAPHLDLGGADLDDLLAGLRYLRGLDEPEVGNVGIWGISYGGYLTLQALVQAPSAFASGVDFAGVADWAEWAHDPGGLWIRGRMGAVDDNATLYRERSPLFHVERLAAPLLVLHGTADQSVPVLQSVRLTDALVRAGKRFDITIYPGEAHAFTYRHTWRDSMARVERFFAETLR
jgi:dipeptidyl aminopeptidase/acylaminoacyl peptidase